jgi:hypothetical protein
MTTKARRVTLCRRFNGEPVIRLIVSVPEATVVAVDRLTANERHPARGCRAEFVRLAIAEKLARDLMISAPASARDDRPRGEVETDQEKPIAAGS